MEISFRLELDELRRKNEALAKELEPAVMGAIREQARDVRREGRAVAPMGATGILRQRIRIKSDRKNLSAEVRAKAPHAHIVTKGRSAGKMPKPEALREWAALVGLAGKEFAIARAIGRRGTRGVPFMAIARSITEGRFSGRVTAAVDGVLARHRGAA